MSAERFEDRYRDVLQNIEYGIVQACRADREILDAHVASALDGLIRSYQAEARGRGAPALRLSLQTQAVFDSARTMCEWRLGREHLLDQRGLEVGLEMTPKALDEIIACLKRIRRQGYVNYIDEFIQ
jgi:hypothetical protein